MGKFNLHCLRGRKRSSKDIESMDDKYEWSSIGKQLREKGLVSS